MSHVLPRQGEGFAEKQAGGRIASRLSGQAGGLSCAFADLLNQLPQHAAQPWRWEAVVAQAAWKRASG